MAVSTAEPIRDEAAARRFFEQAIDLHDTLTTITITLNKSRSNTTAALSLATDSGLLIGLRQPKYLNNLIEQDHRAIKRRTRPMFGFKSFSTATKLVAGIETMLTSRKRSCAASLCEP